MPFHEAHRALKAAIGYLDLGMPQDALEELDQLDPADQDMLEVLEMRAYLQQFLGQWQPAASTYQRLCEREDASVDRFLAWACCLYELKDYPACRDALLAAPTAKADRHALWHFHLACYLALTGDKQQARDRALHALKLEPALRQMALRNSNLGPLLKNNSQS